MIDSKIKRKAKKVKTLKVILSGMKNRLVSNGEIGITQKSRQKPCSPLDFLDLEEEQELSQSGESLK